MKQEKIGYLALALSISVLCACGGSSSGGSGSTPPIGTATPVVASVIPSTATVGTLTTFRIAGTNLPAGMNFSLTNCIATTELAGGTSTLRQFSCTPTGAYGVSQGNIYANASAATSLIGLSVNFQSPIMSVASSAFRNAVVTVDGSLYVWGSGWIEGDGGSQGLRVPTKIGDGYRSVAVSEGSGLGIKTDGTLWSWGSLINETLGTGLTAASYTPVQIGTNFKKVVVKGVNTTLGEFIVGLKNDGTLWIWGEGIAAKLSPPGATLVPLMIPGSGFSDIASGATGDILALKPDGSLWSLISSASIFDPQQIATGYVAITTPYDAYIALKSDGTLWNWGRNAPNQAASGVPSATNPTLVGSGFTSISSGSYYTIAMKDDGSLWGGGDNAQGQFGDGTANGGAFRQVGSGYIAVTATDDCTFAQKGDGTLWAWGFCDFGDGKGGGYGGITQISGLGK